MAADSSIPAPGRTSGLLRAAVLLVVYLTVAWFPVVNLINYPGLGNAGPACGGEDFFGNMIYGRAPKPFVTRVLVPWLVRSAARVTPQSIKTPIERDARLQTRNGLPRWLYQYAFEFWVTKYLLLVFTLGFAFALRWLARLTLGLSGLELDVIPVVTFFCLPGFYGFGSHVYDLPVLCLFTLGLCLIAARRFVPYMLAFVICTLNKETALLLTLVWLIGERRRLSTRQLAGGVALQLMVWVVIRGGLMWLYRSNPGEAITLYLARNVDMLSTAHHFTSFRAVGDWLILPNGFNTLYVLGFVWALFAVRRAPQFLKDALWIALPISVLSWLFANADEMRVYYELLPIVVLVLADSFYRLAGYSYRWAPAKNQHRPGRRARRADG